MRINGFILEETRGRLEIRLTERHEHNPVKVMIWGRICYSSVGTLSKVDSDIYARQLHGNNY